MTDAYYSVHPTPIGEALVVVTGAGLASLSFLDGAAGAVEEALAAESLRLRTVPVEAPASTGTVTDQLDEYFDGQRRDFDLPIDWQGLDGFVRAALEAIRTVPYGQTASYGEIAILAGSPGAHRAAGSACARTPVSLVIPAHRIVRSDGSIGEYGGHPERKRFLLDLETDVSARATAAPATARAAASTAPATPVSADAATGV